MAQALTVGERIVLHLGQYSKYIDSYDAPFDISQDGIAVAIRISRAHAAIELKKLKDSGEVVERLVHIKKGKTKRKVYFLTPPGEARASNVRSFAESEGIDIQPFLDLRKCKGPELWGSLDDELRLVLAKACVFRKPFRRDALPETSVALLPTNSEGMVDLPAELRSSVLSLVEADVLRQCHSAAADHWLDQTEYRERLYHLIKAGRHKEAEMLVSSKGHYLLGLADPDLFSILNQMAPPAERYRGKVLHVQAYTALRAGELGQALSRARELQGLEDTENKVDGMVIEGLVLKVQGHLDQAHGLLVRARDELDEVRVSLECEIAETLLQAGRLPEARATLERMLTGGVRDAEGLERIYYLLGMVHLKAGSGEEAVRLFSKSRGAARDKENGEIYLRLSDAYNMMGMEEKASEYALRAMRVRARS